MQKIMPQYFKNLLALLISTLILVSMPSLQASAKENWYLIYQPLQRTVKTIGVYKDSLFIGTNNGVLTSNDGQSWNDFGSEQLAKDPTGNSTINWIYIKEDTQQIYIGSSFGAYYSTIDKPNWHKFFENTKTESNEVNSLDIEGYYAYLATNNGSWKCNLKNDTCIKLNQGLIPDNITGNYKTFHILRHLDKVLLASTNGIYLLDKTKQVWRKISSNIQSLPDGQINAKHLFIDEANDLWVTCGSGIYKWNGLTQKKHTKRNPIKWTKKSNGLNANNDGFLAALYISNINNKLYTGTENGVYSFTKTNEIWKDITSGIRTSSGNKAVYWLSSFKDELYAATDEGLFIKSSKQNLQPTPIAQNLPELQAPKTSSNKIESQTNNKEEEILLKGKIEAEFTNLETIEPNVVEVQKHALEFASLPTNNDYKKYRLQARLRNIIPKIGFDLNSTDTALGYYQSERGITSDISLNNKFDSNKLTRLQNDGKLFKQVSISWNTNELLYDNEIKEILNLVRLTTNIKENLLDDVTRIYYQRRKLQLDNLLAFTNNTKNKLLKELEIAELTGQLDSRTGGWFSREVQKRKQIQ